MMNARTPKTSSPKSSGVSPHKIKGGRRSTSESPASLTRKQVAFVRELILKKDSTTLEDRNQGRTAFQKITKLDGHPLISGHVVLMPNAVVLSNWVQFHGGRYTEDTVKSICGEDWKETVVIVRSEEMRMIYARLTSEQVVNDLIERFKEASKLDKPSHVHSDSDLVPPPLEMQFLKMIAFPIMPEMAMMLTVVFRHLCEFHLEKVQGKAYEYELSGSTHRQAAFLLAIMDGWTVGAPPIHVIPIPEAPVVAK